MSFRNEVRVWEIVCRLKKKCILSHSFGLAIASEFLHVLRGRTGPLQLSAEQAVHVLALFLAVSQGSTPTTIRYPEFVRYNDAVHVFLFVVMKES